MSVKNYKSIIFFALTGATLIAGAVITPASADEPGRICVSSQLKPVQCGPIGRTAKIAADDCDRPMQEVIAIAREVEETGETRRVCTLGDLAPVFVDLRDDV